MADAMYFDVSLGLDDLGLSGQFFSVSGLTMENDYETYTEGGTTEPHYFFRQVSPQMLVLEQGLVTGVDQFALWMKSIKMGAMVRLAGTITLMDAQGGAVKTWTVTDAYPVKYVGPVLTSAKSSAAVVRIELAHNGLS